MPEPSQPRSEPGSSSDTSSQALQKQLGLFDVYAISTGAMFASGFFLLPGVAAARCGPAVILAYGIASLLMIPTTLAIAELSTTMPRAGGPYYFIDRSFGPAMGAVGGLGVWAVLVLKSAFALVGMGAYLGLVFHFPIEPIAIAATVVLAALNVLGAKQGARLQQILVVTLLTLMVVYVIIGLGWIGQRGFVENAEQQLTPLMPFGTAALLSTVGMVFVSFAGLTKVASVAEEVDRPERNLPLGMGAALLSVTCIYVLGVYVMVATLPPDTLHQNLTPVATAGQSFIPWLPVWAITGLIVLAAVSAFASTANAGLLAASRIPMAMARDGLSWAGFDHLGRFGTPTRAILITALLMIVLILTLDVESLARLASSFLLFVFALLNLTVIMMRESRIESYVPEFRVPLYPYVPLLGIIASVALIAVLGSFYVLFLVSVIAFSLMWYRLYGSRRVERQGAILNVFARLAKHKHEPLEEELWNIMQEHSSSEEDLYDEVVSQSMVLDFGERTTFDEIVGHVAERLGQELTIDPDELGDSLRHSGGPGGPPVASEAVLIDLCHSCVDRPRLTLVRVRGGSQREAVEAVVGEVASPTQTPSTPVIYAALFLVSPEDNKSQHRRILAALSARIEEPGFLETWQEADSDQKLREVFLHSNRFVLLKLSRDTATKTLINQRLEALPLPQNVRVVAVHRGGDTLHPDPQLILTDQDRLTIVGEPEAVQETYQRFGPIASHPDAS